MNYNLIFVQAMLCIVLGINGLFQDLEEKLHIPNSEWNFSPFCLLKLFFVIPANLIKFIWIFKVVNITNRKKIILKKIENDHKWLGFFRVNIICEY